MNVMVPVTGKIAPLIRMLGSPVDGEALAACRAIGRTLATADLDFHDLADIVEQAGLPVIAEQSSPAPKLAPWQLLAMRCLQAGIGSLRPAELDFLRTMVHWPAKPSEKQGRWLDAIAAALGIVREVAA